MKKLDFVFGRVLDIFIIFWISFGDILLNIPDTVLTISWVNLPPLKAHKDYGLTFSIKLCIVLSISGFSLKFLKLSAYISSLGTLVA